MLNMSYFLTTTRLFHSPRIEELQEALTEDDDGPDGVGYLSDTQENDREKPSR